MYKSIFTLLMICAFSFLTMAQSEMRTNVSTFDVIPLNKNGNYNGLDQKGGFWNGHFYYRNSYDTAWKSWSGIAVSNNSDTMINSYTNEYSSITGGGINGTKNYALCYLAGKIIPEKTTKLTGFYVTNTTYTYRTIKEGSAFSKKFGGVTGNDKDWYLLKIESYSGGVKSDSLRFYLADFQSDDNAKDYILNKWTWVDLENFKASDSLVLSFESSDAGAFGINTPTYVAIDDVNAKDPFKFSYVFKPFNFNHPDFFKNGGVWNGQSDTSGGFLLDGLYFENSFNTQWNSWSGWAVSKSKDTSKVGFEAQYTAIPSKSLNNYDSGYAVSYGRSVIRMPYNKDGWLVWLNLNYTNSTYPFKSMKNGDAFSKKFGGITGNDKDYLKFYIIGYDANNKVVDTIGNEEYEKLMLADFRNEPKYIQNKWVQTTQMFHDKIVRMEFQLESTDNGTFGMNTPGYFCLGDFRFMIETLEKTETKKMEIYPNPSSTFINTDIQSPKSFEIIDMTGRQFMLMESPQSNKIDISQLPQGIYYLKVKANEKVYSSRFVKL